jgi:hypothetical protein
LGFFADCLALVDRCLDRREPIVERIEQTLLNVRDKDTSRRRDRPFFDRAFDTCFLGLPDLPVELARLKAQLWAKHRADGFEPVESETTFVNELDPLELILRAYDYWERSRWPGRSGRLRYADTLYAVFMLRLLERLSLRIWDEGSGGADRGLQELQRRLDRLNGSGPVWLRDAGWLIQTAQGPLTKHLRPYLEVADRIAESLPGPRGLAVRKAGARLAGGHLRSQLRYRVWLTNRPADDPENLAFVRTTNALDGALLVRDLVPLLEAYRAACDSEDKEARQDLADAILQGMSADPELFVTRLDLLGPYVTIEHLFVEQADGEWRRTAMGERHRLTLERYASLAGQCAPCLIEDAGTLDPSRAAYSPLGITYGFVADVMSNMAQDSLVGPAGFALSLEDMFASWGNLGDKLARASQWAALPRRKGEYPHFDCSVEWAAERHARLTAALQTRAAHPSRPNASDVRQARIHLGRAEGAVPAADHCVSSDASGGWTGGASFHSEARLIADRNEGRYLASVRTNHGWFGISKVVLTLLTSQGRDVAIESAPDAAIDVLSLTCPAILATPLPPDPISAKLRP